MSDTARISITRFKVPDAFWHGLELIGLKPPAVLRLARLPATLHLRELRDRRQVSTEEFFRLWEAVQSLSNDPAIGILLATGLNTAVLPPSSVIAFAARDYRDGLHRLARFKQLCAPERVMVDVRGQDCTITIDWWQASGKPPPLLIDASFTSIVELGRRGTGSRIVPRKIELARPDDGSGIHAKYFQCPVRFGTQRDALVLDAADLNRPFPGHNPELLEMLSPALSAALAEANTPATVGHQVKTALKRILASGRPEMSEIARELGMSERTLQRRITEEGTSFRQLVLETRQDLVRHLLADKAIEIDEVAYLVGYEDTNSFYRAFRSWEGTTPARWRALEANRSASSAAH